MSVCNICPKECAVDRGTSVGFCGVPDTIKVARAALHFYEEPPISGTAGSGTVFFCGCNLKCVFCQNKKISRGQVGKEISVDRLADIFLDLEKQGAHNINLVTPTHYILQIREALIKAKEKGLRLPILYNSSGYEKASSLKLLKGLVDIYLPDFKYFDNNLALLYSKAPDYFEKASEALDEMVRQVGGVVMDNGLIKKGVIVRHLVLPTHTDDSKKIISYLYRMYGKDIIISIMNQYTPLYTIEKYPYLNRTLTENEYNDVVNYALSLGIDNAFIQEGQTANDSFIPDFDCTGV